MKNVKLSTRALLALSCSIFAASTVDATTFNVPGGSLETALDAYSAQSGVQLVIPNDELKGIHSSGVRGVLDDSLALSRILTGTGYIVQRNSAGMVGIVKDRRSEISVSNIQVAQAAAPKSVETVTVTSSKLGGADVQSIPISITALSQEQLTATQTAGGPDLIKQVPNMTFTKTNFSGYSIQIRGIGTQAISVTTDPAVAVAFNDIPFIRNHFFEQEFYDTAQVEVLRGPQGTLYGRNATAGVVNLSSAKPTDQFEAMISAEIGSYHQRRFEGMINVPLIDDRVDVRLAGEWTKRQGYSFNDTTDQRIDGRDLWSGRLTVGIKPIEPLQIYIVWEHFSESDDRIRSAKQLCKTDPGVGEIDGVPKPMGFQSYGLPGNFFNQGCLPTFLYSSAAFGAPNGNSLPYVTGLYDTGNGNGIDPYASESQSRNVRVIESELDPVYKAKNDIAEVNADYQFTPGLTFSSQTGFSSDFLYSAEDYNRFGAVPGLFTYQGDGTNPDLQGVLPDPYGNGVLGGGPELCKIGADPSCTLAGYFCDPQVGCSDRLILEDLSEEHAWQFTQEFRVSSHFSGPVNFSAGGNYLHYETEERYYVFGNALTLINGGYVPGLFNSNTNSPLDNGFQFNDPALRAHIAHGYADPNPISHLDGNGHNYFLSKNPYVLNSYALFGEASYEVFQDLKVTGGLRWTEDQKHFPLIPSWLVDSGWGYPVAGVVNQQWDQFTGRAVIDWSPKLTFSDQTLLYGSYSHGYKAGGANPPGAIFSSQFQAPGSLGNPSEPVSVQPTHPLTFRPEFVDAFELGTKNAFEDGALTLNADFFYYNYENYQVSQIVDRTAINLNFDAHAKGAEIEAMWEPLPDLRFNFAGGWEDTAIAKGQSAIDLMDRTAGNSGWYVVRPFVNEASNCIFPTSVAKYLQSGSPGLADFISSYCAIAYILHLDPLTQAPYTTPVPSTDVFGGELPVGYQGFDPATAPNNGEGFAKSLGGNKLPNSPPFTVSVGAQYSTPISNEWAGTIRIDGYYQDSSWWRVFNDLQYDKLHGYATMNLTFIFTSQNGWQVMLYDKNVFNTAAITGAFLNSDDSGLTTNIFLTDPKLIGIRVTKNW